MRIAVAGGTGMVGKHIVTALSSAGHEPVVLARSTGVDVISSEGLDAALAGVDVVIDASNVMTSSGKKAAAFFEHGGRNLLAAGERAGVRHHIVVSIIGIDLAPIGYYVAKQQQEAVAKAGPIPWTIVRVTQFHEFAGQVLARVPGPVAFVPSFPTQPIAAHEVGTHLAGLAAGPALGMAPELAGPDVHQLPDLCRAVLKSRGSSKPLVAVPFPGKGGAAMKDGALLPASDGPRGVERFADWLAAHPSGS
jgi:uncharacterized protein YbjT (DUF2867 family)